MNNKELLEKLELLILECEQQSKIFADSGLTHSADCSAAMGFAYQNIRNLILSDK